ncbi:protein of unknown function [Clostridium beijerinckii]|nr:protein of unknown function [Clostridium beijerinckii]
MFFSKLKVIFNFFAILYKVYVKILVLFLEKYQNYKKIKGNDDSYFNIIYTPLSIIR